MTSRERILTAMRSGRPDRVPVITYIASVCESGDFLNKDPSYSQIRDCVGKYGDICYQWWFPGGFIFSDAEPKHRKRLFVDSWGNERIETIFETPKGDLVEIRETGRLMGTIKYLIETKEDVEKVLSIPYSPWRPDLTEFFRLRDAWGEKALVEVAFMSSTSALGRINQETCALWTITERDTIRELVNVAHRRIVDGIDYLLENDVGPVYYINGPERMLPPLMSPKDFDEFVVPHVTELIERIHRKGCLVHLHSHGKVNNFLEKFADMGADALNPLEPPPLGDVILSEAKKRVGHRMCLVGNIQYDELRSYSTEEVRQRVKGCIRDAAEGGGFMLMPCACFYESPIPKKISDNWIEMIKACREYGAYPVRV